MVYPNPITDIRIISAGFEEFITNPGLREAFAVLLIAKITYNTEENNIIAMPINDKVYTRVRFSSKNIEPITSRVANTTFPQ